MVETNELWKGILELLVETATCYGHKLYYSAIVLSYVTIDMMGYLSMADEQNETNKTEFIRWVDTYLKSTSAQGYQYRGIDVYAARCAIVHTFSSEAKLHRNDPTIMQFGYSNAPGHGHFKDVGTNHVVISIESLVRDVKTAVNASMIEWLANDSMRKKLESRLPGLFQMVPVMPKISAIRSINRQPGND